MTIQIGLGELFVVTKRMKWDKSYARHGQLPRLRASHPGQSSRYLTGAPARSPARTPSRGRHAPGSASSGAPAGTAVSAERGRLVRRVAQH